MKKLLFILAAAAVMTGCANNDKQQNQQSMNEQIVLDNIATRVSVRQFTGEKILQEHVDKLLHAAMSAPSAINRQPWAFVVVTDQQLLDQMGEARCCRSLRYVRRYDQSY